MKSEPLDEHGSVVEVDDGLKQSCWTNLPQELLREVLMRIEVSEKTWPLRKNVVACAGVCRTWRQITKEIVKTPELSGNLTFPISVKQPGPRESLVQCFIKRNRATQTYHLYLCLNNALTEDGKFLLAARKCKRPTHTDFIISLRANHMSRDCNTYIGRLRSNFLGTKFTIYDGLPPHARAKVTKSHSTRLVGLKQFSPRFPASDFPIAHISYESNVQGSRAPRRVHCVIDAIPASAIEPDGVAPTQTNFCSALSFFKSKSIRAENFQSEPLAEQRNRVLVLKNKDPMWHEQLNCWCLNFHGRVTVASVKNFQLVASPENGLAGQENEKIILQFGKFGKDLFTVDYRYPISAFQAFAICLSSFDTKIACE